MTRPVDKMFPKEALRKKMGRCPTCNGEIGDFKDDLSRTEFKISGCCQKCQDQTFGE